MIKRQRTKYYTFVEINIVKQASSVRHGGKPYSIEFSPNQTQCLEILEMTVFKIEVNLINLKKNINQTKQDYFHFL